MTPTTMSAVRAYGPDPGTLNLEQVPVPKAGPGEVLVAVRATAVTAGELSWSDTWPLIPAHDLSGVVAEVRDGVTDLRVGDEVLLEILRAGTWMIQRKGEQSNDRV